MGGCRTPHTYSAHSDSGCTNANAGVGGAIIATNHTGAQVLGYQGVPHAGWGWAP